MRREEKREEQKREEEMSIEENRIRVVSVYGRQGAVQVTSSTT